MKLAFGVAVALTLGCGAAVPPLPSKGGPVWRELTSEHFVVWTDGSREAGTRLVQRMEDLRQAVIGIGFRGAGGQGRVFVLALRDQDEVGAYVDEGVGAAAVPSHGYLSQPFILTPVVTRSGRELAVAAHELTHTISHVVIQRQPRWFGEGLAEYFETIEIDRERGTIDLGRGPTYKGQPARQAHLLPIETLFRCGHQPCDGYRFYSTAWALFTYLTNQHAAKLATYEQSLIDTEGNHDQAWLDAFGNTSLESLYVDMRAWLVAGSHTVLHFNAVFKTWPVTERTLGDPDVRAARALMLMQFQGRNDEAKVEIAAALALERTHVLAQWLAFQLDQKTPLDPGRVRATVTAHPDDWRAWFLLVTALETGTEADTARARACGLIAVNPAIESPLKCLPLPVRAP